MLIKSDAFRSDCSSGPGAGGIGGNDGGADGVSVSNLGAIWGFGDSVGFGWGVNSLRFGDAKGIDALICSPISRDLGNPVLS